MSKLKPKNLYFVPNLFKALDVLELLQQQRAPLSLEAIYQRVDIPKTTVYRILKSFEHRGYVGQSQDGLYRVVIRPKKLLFGFAGQSSEMPFSEAVTKSLKTAATAFGIDLLVLDNRYDADIAVENADRLVEQHVDLAIEFQIEESVAAVIADKISSAGIPLIAVDMPHPHATYYGADNYRNGFSAGQILARHAIEHWKSKVSRVIGLDLEQAGPFVRNRTTGAFDAIKALLPDCLMEIFVRAESRGLRDKSYKLILDFLKRHPKERRILIASHNDTVALGALSAVRELKREKHVAIVGHDGIAEAMEELAVPNSPFIGSVAKATERYGEELITLGLAILRGQVVPPYNFAQHEVITRDSLALMTPRPTVPSASILTSPEK